MAFSGGSQTGVSSEINITPLIDVLLVLLIIFMVLVPLKPQGLDSSIPQGTSPAASVGPVTVRVERAGAESGSGAVRYRVGERAVTLDQVGAALAAAFSVRPDRTVFVQADRELSYQPVAEVVARARRAGAGQVSLSALPAMAGGAHGR